MKLFKIIILIICFSVQLLVNADDGYRAWLRYDPVKDPQLLREYSEQIHTIASEGISPSMKAAQEELREGLSSLLNKDISIQNGSMQNETVLIGTPANNKAIAALHLESSLKPLGEEGFLIRATKNGIVITANTDMGVLYGAFHFLKLIQTGQSLKNISVTEKPKIKHRVLNHWDNLDHTVERGYAGESLWRWHELPEYKSTRYRDYARLNASIGINGTVLNNVNANAQILTEEYLKKVKALAEVFRPYGIKVYLTARFSAPIEIGELKTADPLDPEVISWWNGKVKEIYEHIPDFGGFLVKANSEGQPGPQDYKRTHADGANVLANALKPYGGIVMWRAFVYGNKPTDDRVKQAYDEFMPFDGKFAENVLVQPKNGPLDFQPREAFHPLFGAMKKTPS
jgi:alpha-glucuronidase